MTGTKQDPADRNPPRTREVEVADWTQASFARAQPDAAFEAARALAASAERTLNLSHVFAESGRQIDLTGLDLWIGRLTASVLDLDPQDGQRMRPVLECLLAGLDRLEHAVTTRAPPATSPPASQ